MQDDTVKIETPAGIIDGMNDEFEVDHLPTVVTLNGLTYYEGDGYTVTVTKIKIKLQVKPQVGSTLRSLYQ